MHCITLQLVSYSFEGHDLWLGEVKAPSRLLLQSKLSPGQERVKKLSALLLEREGAHLGLELKALSTG